MLDSVEMAPPDPILGVSEAFRACEDPNKLNLGVGAYRNEQLQPIVLDVVSKVRLLIQCSYNYDSRGTFVRCWRVCIVLGMMDSLSSPDYFLFVYACTSTFCAGREDHA